MPDGGRGNVGLGDGDTNWLAAADDDGDADRDGVTLNPAVGEIVTLADGVGVTAAVTLIDSVGDALTPGTGDDGAHTGGAPPAPPYVSVNAVAQAQHCEQPATPDTGGAEQ